MKASLAKAFRVLNELKKHRIIENYALGGAVGAVFYMEPVPTYDLDVFITLPASDGRSSLNPVWSYLLRKGHRVRGDRVNLHGVPVHFLTPYSDLVEEAVEEAVGLPYGKTKVRVMRVEHLLAQCLGAGRPKDYLRMIYLLDEAEIDRAYFRGVLRRHGLLKQWGGFHGKRQGSGSKASRR